jgi:hypothetical protein
VRYVGKYLQQNCPKRQLIPVYQRIMSKVGDHFIVLYLSGRKYVGENQDKERIIARFLLYLGFILDTLTWGCLPDAGKPIPPPKKFLKPWAHLPKGHYLLPDRFRQFHSHITIFDYGFKILFF